jgi:hypothetical protein
MTKTGFVSLPTELRLKIWALILPEGRVIEPPRSSHEPCNLRSICRESRRFYLEFYHEIHIPQYKPDYLHNILKPGTNIINQHKSSYFCPEKDLLVFDYDKEFDLMKHLELGTIEQIATKDVLDCIRFIASVYIPGRVNTFRPFTLGAQDHLLSLLAKYLPNVEEFIILLGGSLPVIRGPVQIPVGPDSSVPEFTIWERQGPILDQARISFNEFQLQHQHLIIPQVRVFIRTFDGLMDVEQDSYPWGNNGC